MLKSMLQHIQSTIPPHCRPANGEPLVLGISGGPDSTALAFLMRELSDANAYGWRLHLAHLNHGLRGARSDHDADFVMRMAMHNEWRITVEHSPVGELAERSGVTLEEAARNQRYAFFERVLEETGATIAATAHHADDNIETILHRVLRGTGIRGLSGIPAARPLRTGTPYHLIRPLLNIRRTEILRYLQDNGIPSCSDHTNESSEYTRNRIRNELIPALETEYNPAVGEALLRLARQAGWMSEFLGELTEAKFPELVLNHNNARQPAEITLDAAALLREPKALQTELVRRAITTIGVGQKKLTFDHLNSIIELADKNVSGKRLERAAGLTVDYERKRLTFRNSAGD